MYGFAVVHNRVVGKHEGKKELPNKRILDQLEYARPFEAAEMLQRVFLFGEPSLTADFLDALFTQLQADGPWRRRLPELSARLHDTLLSGGSDAHYARAFSLVHLGHSDSGARGVCCLYGAAAR